MRDPDLPGEATRKAMKRVGSCLGKEADCCMLTVEVGIYLRSHLHRLRAVCLKCKSEEQEVARTINQLAF
jgi:hypothetical protein